MRASVVQVLGGTTIQLPRRRGSSRIDRAPNSYNSDPSAPRPVVAVATRIGRRWRARIIGRFIAGRRWQVGHRTQPPLEATVAGRNGCSTIRR